MLFTLLSSKSTAFFDNFRRRRLTPAKQKKQVINMSRATDIPTTVALNDSESWLNTPLRSYLNRWVLLSSLRKTCQNAAVINYNKKTRGKTIL